LQDEFASMKVDLSSFMAKQCRFGHFDETFK